MDTDLPIRALFVKEGRELYGAEMATVRLLGALNPDKVQAEVMVFEYENRPSDFLAALLQREIPFRVVRSNSDLRHRIRQEAKRFDCVISVGYKCHILMWWALRGLKIQRYGICHGWVNTDWKLRLYNGMARWCLKRFDGVMTVAPTITTGHPNTCCISNGIDVGEVLALSRQCEERRCVATGNRYVVYVGRLGQEKGLHDLLEAFAGIEEGTDLVIAGDGPLRVALQEHVRRLELDSRVHFPGHLDNPLPLIAGAEVLVLPSYTEGTPLVVLEAMAAGTLVIACAVGGVPDMIRDGETGMLIDPRDTSGLTAVLQKALTDSECREQIVCAAADWVAASSTIKQTAIRLEGFLGW